MTSNRNRKSSSVYSQSHASDSHKTILLPSQVNPSQTGPQLETISDDLSLRSRRRLLPKSPTRGATQRLFSSLGSQRSKWPPNTDIEQPDSQDIDSINPPAKQNKTPAEAKEEPPPQNQGLRLRHKKAFSHVRKLSSSLSRAFSTRVARMVMEEGDPRSTVRGKKGLRQGAEDPRKDGSKAQTSVRADGESSITLVERGQSRHSSRRSSSNYFPSSSTDTLRPFSYVPELIDHGRPAHAEHPPIPAKSPMRQYFDLPSSLYESIVSNDNSRSSAIAHSVDSYAEVDPRVIGKWLCCKCRHGWDIVEIEHGHHLVGIVHCACGHCSCTRCTLVGNIRAYKPVEDPFLVPCLDDDKKGPIRYGVFCGQCGLSWRAQPVDQSRFKRVRRSRSMADLFASQSDRLHHSNSAASVRTMANELQKTHGQQAPSRLVTLTGIRCTCTNILNTNALCFRLVKAIVPPQNSPTMDRATKIISSASFSATAADKARGIQTSILSLHKYGKTVQHPNPLMSNPIGLADLESVGAGPAIPSSRTIT